MIAERQANKELVELSNAQIQDILTLLEVKFTQGGSWISACCPVHKGDNHHAFAFNLQKGYWKCFTHDCHEKWGHNIVGLVSGVLGYNYNDSVGWLLNNVKEVAGLKQKVQRTEDRIYPEKCLLRLFKTDFYVKRGFSALTVSEFEHGQAQTGIMIHRVVFPVRDDKGLIRGFSGRWSGTEREIDGKLQCVTEAGKAVPKWRHTKLNKMDYLYNFYRAKDNCKEELILVESIGNVMRFWDCGKKNCVACLGSALSPKHIKMLCSTTKKVVLAFDNDNAGRKVLKKARKMLEQYVDLKIITPPEGKDWAECTNEEVLKIYDGDVCQS